METTLCNKSLLSLSERDHSFVWHPFAVYDEVIPLSRGESVYLYAEDGTRYIDAISSWWCNLHGHSHPYIAEKIAGQMHKLEHVIFSGFTHQPAVELAERLIKILPGEMSRIFYTDNGATAVESALKIALQYWQNRDASTQRKKIICFNRGYHGDTFGAMSVSGRTEFNRPFWSYLFDVAFIDPPLKGCEERALQQITKLVEAGDVAAFIYEPLVLGAAGMLIYSALDPLLKACREKDVLLIADEVMTGFGRTGTLFASEQLSEKSDLICLSKGLTGGFLPIGVTACKSNVYDMFIEGGISKKFLHGHTYAGNPLACTAALASLDLLVQESCTAQRSMIHTNHQRFCAHWSSHPRLIRCECLGTLLVLEYSSERPGSYFNTLRESLYQYFLKQGILIRPLGNIVYVMPPYCITEEQLHYIYQHLIKALEIIL